jgi:hypothetical protein
MRSSGRVVGGRRRRRVEFGGEGFLWWFPSLF